MLQTLFIIPRQIAGIDVFGIGWLLAIWAVATVAVVGYALWRHGWSGETGGQMFALAIVGAIVAFVLPRIVQAEGLMVRGYGLMFLVSVVAGVGLSYYRAMRRGLDLELMLSLATWLIVSGIIGARLFYVIEYWDKFQKPTLPETVGAMLNLTEGGLVVFGSMLAGGAALVVFIYRYKLPGLALADLIAPGVVLGAALGRIGCLMNGCCYGDLSDVPWAVEFPITSPAFVDQAQRGQVFVHGLIFKASGAEPAVIAQVQPDSAAARAGLAPDQQVSAVNGKLVESVEEAQFQLLSTYGAGTQVSVRVFGDASAKAWTIVGPAPRSRPVHPTQLYSLIDGLLLCLFLLAYEPFRRRDGELTALVLTIHPVMRFLLEVIRVDESPVFHTPFSISQNISIGLFAGGIVLWLYLLWRPLGCAWQAILAPPKGKAVAHVPAGYGGSPI